MVSSCHDDITDVLIIYCTHVLNVFELCSHLAPASGDIGSAQIRSALEPVQFSAVVITAPLTSERMGLVVNVAMWLSR